MKIQVDDNGWAVVSEPSDPSVKPSSGVYPKAGEETGKQSTEPAEIDAAALGEAKTEPSIPSAEAIQIGAAPLPPPSSLPGDLLALANAATGSDDSSKVA
jgi:hypothetical protein